MANIPKVWNGTAFIELEAAATVAPAASTTVVGIVQLTDSTSSTSTTTAATPNSVKSAYDLAGTAIPKDTVTAEGDLLYASGSATVTRLGIGTANQVLSVGTAGIPTWAAAAAGGGVLKYEEFTSSGSFVMPANTSGSAIAVVEVISGGVGGDGGAKVTGTSAEAQGGSGGHGGHYGMWTIPALALGTAGGTVTVTVGAGGAGGTANTAAAGTVAGGNGGSSSFGSITVPGSRRGSSGMPQVVTGSWWRVTSEIDMTANDNVATGTANQVSPVSGNHLIGPGGMGGITNNANMFRSGIDAGLVGGGGGSGGGFSRPSASYKSGGNSGKRYGWLGAENVFLPNGSAELKSTFGNGHAGGGSAVNGTNGTTDSGNGGSGGGAGDLVNAGSGGAGAVPGGGGGGGGAGRSANSGAGGAGGSGRVRVWIIQ